MPKSPADARKLTYAAFVIDNSLVLISCLFELAGVSARSLSDIIFLKHEACIQLPSNHQAPQDQSLF